MSIIIKKINNKQYAYESYRKGKKIIHKYIGPLSDSNVVSAIDTRKQRNKVPERFYSYFWDTDPKKLNLKNNSNYIIERGLELGSLDIIEWLQKIYPSYKIIDCSLHSKRISQKSKNFWDTWFGENK